MMGRSGRKYAPENGFRRWGSWMRTLGRSGLDEKAGARGARDRKFKANSLNLDASLKKATAVTGDVTPPDGGKDNTGDTTQGGGTNQGGDSTQTGGSGNTESSGSDGGDGLE